MAACGNASEVHLNGHRQTSCPELLIAIIVAAGTPGVLPDSGWGPVLPLTWGHAAALLDLLLRVGPALASRIASRQIRLAAGPVLISGRPFLVSRAVLAIPGGKGQLAALFRVCRAFTALAFL